MRIYRIFLSLAALALFIALQGSYPANAHGQTNDQLTEQAQELVQLDENISAEDLGVTNPTILPNNRLYFLKNFRRGVQSFFTFNPVKRAELKLQFANEKIAEAQKLANQTADQTVLKNAIENYTQETEQVKKEIEKVSDKIQGSAVAEKILDAQIKHYKILSGLMREYSDIAPEIEQIKQDAAKNFAESASAILSPEELRQKLPDIVERQKGSQFREFKNLEVLQALKDVVPEQAKPAIQHAIQEASKNFEKDFSQASEPLRDTFKVYMEKMGGNEVRHLEVLDTIKPLVESSLELNEKLDEARDKIHEQIEKRFENIKEKERKRVFISHLEKGDLNKIRTLQELESNLSPEVLPTVLEIKQKSEQRIREKFEQAQSQADLQNFFKEVEQKPDVRMMTVVKDIASFVPENKQELVKKLEKKIFDETRRQMEEAQKRGMLENKLRNLSGNDPEDVETLNEFKKKFAGENGLINQLDKQQAQRIQERFEVLRQTSQENPTDEDALRKTDSLRLRIEENPTVETKIKILAPSIVQNFKKLEEQKEENVSPEHVKAILQKAENTIHELSLRLDKNEVKEEVKNSARKLLQNAKEKLERAREALAAEKLGHAFGQANAALHDASNGLRMLEKRGSVAEPIETTKKEVLEKENVRVELKKPNAEQSESEASSKSIRTPLQEKPIFELKPLKEKIENTSTSPVTESSTAEKTETSAPSEPANTESSKEKVAPVTQE
ncbi:MAG: hypothetical protein HYV65_01375 [Candidatus Spechtbacteria bacterium]|nr:hypothetical protein [Candidatus Spechtbacteria bacterium]